MFKAVLHGYYGFHNAGDDAILESIIDGLAKESAIADVQLQLYIIVNESTYRIEERANIEITFVRRADWLHVIRAIKQCHVFISGGGSLLQDVTSWRTVPYYTSVIDLAHLYHKPVFIYSQGIGPVRRTWLSRKIRKTLNKANYISVRDEGSAKWLQDNNINNKIDVVVDPVFGYPQIHRSQQEHPLNKVVGLALRKWNDPSNYEWSQELIHSISEVSNKYPKLAFELIPFHEPVDREFSEQLIRKIRAQSPHLTIEVAPKLHSTAEIMQRISSYELLIGMRLHALIFAAVQQVPVIGISYDPKVEQLMKQLDREVSGRTDHVYSQQLVFDIMNVLERRESIINSQNEMVKSMQKSVHAPAKKIIDTLNHPRVTVLGLNIVSYSMPRLVEIIIQRALQKQKTHVVTLNPMMIMEAKSNEKFAKAIQSAELIVPDGIGILWASKRTSMPIRERIPGIDLMHNLLEEANNRKMNVYLLGAKPDVVERTCKVIQEKYPHLVISGYHHGYFSAEEHPNIVNNIAQSNSDFLFVARSLDGQESWLYEHKELLNVPIMMGVGGSFDVISGATPRAPRLLRKIGLEWLFRMLIQPTRLPRYRNLLKFIYTVLKE